MGLPQRLQSRCCWPQGTLRFKVASSGAGARVSIRQLKKFNASSIYVATFGWTSLMPTPMGCNVVVYVGET